MRVVARGTRLAERRAEIARECKAKLESTELAIDEVAIQMAELAATIIRARQEGRVSMMMGHDVYDSACEAQRHISAARAALGRAHVQAGAAAADLGLTTAVGADQPKPGNGPNQPAFWEGSASDALRVVG